MVVVPGPLDTGVVVLGILQVGTWVVHPYTWVAHLDLEDKMVALVGYGYHLQHHNILDCDVQ